MNIFKYISLGITVFECVISMIALVKAGPLTADAVWLEVSPVLGTIVSATGAKINMDLAHKVITDAVDTINAALHPSA